MTAHPLVYIAVLLLCILVSLIVSVAVLRELVTLSQGIGS